MRALAIAAVLAIVGFPAGAQQAQVSNAVLEGLMSHSPPPGVTEVSNAGLEALMSHSPPPGVTEVSGAVFEVLARVSITTQHNFMVITPW